jgi:hypothetical protein
MAAYAQPAAACQLHMPAHAAGVDVGDTGTPFLLELSPRLIASGYHTTHMDVQTMVAVLMFIGETAEASPRSRQLGFPVVGSLMSSFYYPVCSKHSKCEEYNKKTPDGRLQRSLVADAERWRGLCTFHAFTYTRHFILITSFPLINPPPLRLTRRAPLLATCAEA